ncbi:MAG: SMC-Scp complex subunit ScpB [Dehalococcoidia bacterium]|nr:SMC-Scp complex subunit ScpB [Dehalococcoidia bacterium]
MNAQVPGTEGTVQEAVPADLLKQALESLVFVAPEPVHVNALARTVGWPPGKVRTALLELEEDCRSRGLRLQRTGEAVQFVTDPDVADVVQRFLGIAEKRQLTRGALETLAIVAFKQPVTRATIDTMRGVNSDYMLTRLRESELIEEVGRENAPGRPLIYGTSFNFLEYFGLEGMEELRRILDSITVPSEDGSPQPSSETPPEGAALPVSSA